MNCLPGLFLEGRKGHKVGGLDAYGEGLREAGVLMEPWLRLVVAQASKGAETSFQQRV